MSKRYLIVYNASKRFEDLTVRIIKHIIDVGGSPTSMSPDIYRRLEIDVIVNILEEQDRIIIIQPTEDLFMLAGQANCVKIPTIMLQHDVALGHKAISESEYVRSLSLFTPVEKIIEELDDIERNIMLENKGKR